MAELPTAQESENMELTEDPLDEDIEVLRQKVQEMEEQIAGQQTELAEVGGPKDEGEGGDDNNSIYIGQVDYSATPEELHSHFAECGFIKRVTILCDKWTGHPKGYAYMEFDDPSAVDKAINLHDSTFKGRQLKVLPKRINIHRKKGLKGGKAAAPFGGGGKGYKGAFPTWWDPNYYSSGYSPYAAAAAAKGKAKGKKGWMTAGKKGKGGYKGW
ncbi:Polyadenylate-binding protein 2 [Diplonema papillatum]|nr:Polyadenylate-binding protein 2 [Diplonema papillatum]